MEYSIICAYTAQSNSSLTDSMRYVPHIVKYIEDGVKKEVTLSAECPMDATDKVHARMRRKQKEGK